jgi:hypothetical protein
MNKNTKSLITFFSIFIFSIVLIIVFKNIKNNLEVKKNQIKFLEKNLDNKKSQLANIHTKLLKKNVNIENILFENGINFKNNSNKNFNIGDQTYILKEFNSNDIIFAKHPAASSSAYVDYHEDKIFLITATGQIVFTNIEDLEKSDFSLKKIDTNIQELIKYSEFFSSSGFGIKDTLIRDNQIYVSYIKEHFEDCYSLSILKAKLNFKYLNFEDFYVPDQCVSKDDKFYAIHEHDYLVAHQSGGRLIIFEEKLFFSTGDFRNRSLAQEASGEFGKLISINLKTNKKKIVSIGHRNPQGLYYHKNLNYLFSTEHGPSGGDEINVLDLNQSYNEPPNYGWPLSSYGRHYFDNDDDNDIRYKLSPLKKSHSKYGFIEPLKYFDPSVAISQIVGVNNDFYNTDGNVLFVGTMGTAKKLKEGMISLYFFEMKNNKIINDQFIPIKSRVRDMIYYEKKNYIIMYLETNNSLAIFKKVD